MLIVSRVGGVIRRAIKVGLGSVESLVFLAKAASYPTGVRENKRLLFWEAVFLLTFSSLSL